MSDYKLTTELKSLSSSRDWDRARLEWSLDQVYEVEDPEECLCGHYPIKEVCELRNKVNGNIAIVGNCCVKKFTNLPSEKIFNAITKVRQDITNSFNSATIEHAFEKKWIGQWSRDFYIDIWRKRELSDKQLAQKIRINKIILPKVKKN